MSSRPDARPRYAWPVVSSINTSTNSPAWSRVGTILKNRSPCTTFCTMLVSTASAFVSTWPVEYFWNAVLMVKKIGTIK